MDIVQRNEQNGNSDSAQLVDRLDGAIGEASASIGMMMSELVRRSLRGGVGDIGVTLQTYAREQVSSAVANAMPQISEQCELVAEKATLRITDGVEKRIGDELKLVETRTNENTQIIAARIKSESDAAIEVVSKAIGESRETAEGAARELKDLQAKARESWKKVQTDLQSLHEGRNSLEAQLQEARNLLSQSSQQISQQQEQLAGLGRQLEQSQQELLTTRQQLAEQQRHLLETRKQLTAASQQLTEQTQQLSQQAQKTSQDVRGLHSTAGQFASRLDELERPKGIRALFSKFTGKKKNTSSPPDDSPEEIA